jgi:hypothetical protein
MGVLKQETEKRPLMRAAVMLAQVWLWLGIMPFIGERFGQMLGYSYLPSTEWVTRTNLAGFVVGLISGALVLWFLVIKKVLPDADVKRFFVLLGTPVFGFFLGRNVVVIAVPMIIALVAGHQVELPFTVAHADHSGGRGCHSPIDLQEMPFFWDRLCDVPDTFRHALSPGKHIAVIGLGSSLGVFAEDLHRLD